MQQYLWHCRWWSVQRQLSGKPSEKDWIMKLTAENEQPYRDQWDEGQIIKGMKDYGEYFNLVRVVGGTEFLVLFTVELWSGPTTDIGIAALLIK